MTQQETPVPPPSKPSEEDATNGAATEPSATTTNAADGSDSATGNHGTSEPTGEPTGEAQAASEATEANAPPPAEAAPKPTEVKLSFFARTDVGQVREHNEDNFLVADITRKSRGLHESKSAVGPHGHLFAVCDGMGGAAAGEIASQLAVDIIYERMVDSLDPNRAIERNEIARRLVRSVESAGLRIFQEAKVDRTRRGMGTTVTAASLVDSHLFLAQVGDSRGYILRGEKLVQVTRDQSLVNQLIEAGQLTEEEAETFEHNNIILQALGTADTVQVDLTFAELCKGDTLLLCSDGLSGMVRFDEIRETLLHAAEPIDACKALTERANMAGGHDNITVIIVRFDGDGLPDVTPDTEALRYRKYPLPEEGQATAPSIPPVAGSGPASEHPPESRPASERPPPSSRREPVAGASTRSGSNPPPVHRHEDDHIDIPGTHIPSWVVLLLALVVIGVLVTAALSFLR